MRERSGASFISILCSLYCMYICIADDPNSTVYGDLSNGYFIGFIMTQGKHLFVEPAWK